VPTNYFDERIAKSYEAKWPELFEPAVVDPVVELLAELAGTGAALELGIGTGRLALPLRRRGAPVHGIELSPDMVAELRTKPGGDDLGVTIGDLATTRVDATFALAYLVRNTITNLTSQDDQVVCFRNVAAHLEPGGRFVIEVYIPQLQRLPPGESVHAFTVTPTHLGFEEYDLARQIAFSHHYWVVDGQLETYSTPHRYVWPSELDLMARLAGMRLRERWSDWHRAPFTSDSTSHVSVWEKPPQRPQRRGQSRRSPSANPGGGWMRPARRSDHPTTPTSSDDSSTPRTTSGAGPRPWARRMNPLIPATRNSAYPTT
jgi:SAM-dependent methyltransferase